MFQRTKLCTSLLVAFGGGLLAAHPAFAQNATDTAAVQRIEVTGSSLRRVDAETSVPVTVIKASDLKSQGITSVEQILSVIAASQPTLGTSQVVGNNTGGASFADIHGLGANKTLVLLNGRRISNNAFSGSAPDLNMIPFAAIERVEVLRDGASSLYGTDAIGGVINFITRRDWQGGEVSVAFDKPQHPGGERRDVNFGFGFGDLARDGFNIFGFVDYSKTERISASQRNYNVRQPGGISPTPFPANYFQGDAFGNPAAPDCNQNPYLTPADATSCYEATAGFVDYTPKVERLSGYGKAAVKVFGDSIFSLEGFASHDSVASQIAPVPYGGLHMNPFLPDGVTPNPYYPGNAQGPTPNIPLDPTYTGGLTPDQMASLGLQPGYINVKWRDLSHGPRIDTPVNDQLRLVASLDGTLGDWDYGVGVTYNQNTVKDFVRGYSDGTMITPAVLDGVINPFSLTQSAAGQSVIAASGVDGLLQSASGKVTTVDGHVGHDLGDWLHAGRAAQIAVGGEFRSEKFEDSANAPIAERIVASTGISPDLYQAGSRHVYAAYTELNIPILKSLDVTAAVRYDHYSDFGGTTNPKLSFRFEPTKMVLLRGSWSTGFRAPTLYDINAAESYGTPGTVSDPLYCPGGVYPDNPPAGYPGKAQVCKIQPEVLNGGNKNLKPEKSKNATLGVVIEPTKDITFGVDAYHITFTNSISSLAISTLTDPDTYALFQQYYHRNSQGLLSTDGASCPGPTCGYIDTRTQNLGGVLTDGLDFSATYRHGLGTAGKLDFTYSSTWVHRFAIQQYQGDNYHNNVGVYYNGGPVFRWQHNAEIMWNVKPVTLGLAGHYKTGYLDADPNVYDTNGDPIPGATQKVKSYGTMDAWATWSQGVKGYSVTGGVRNLFDRDPPYSNQTDVFQANYDPRFTDPTGRTFYVRASYTW